MPRDKAVARCNQRLVAGLFRVEIHIIFGMLAEIGPVVFGRHLVEREPAILRLRLMRDQRHAPLLEMRHDIVEARIVEEHALAGGILRDHADVFPHLHPDSAARQRRVDRALGAPASIRACQSPPC